MAQGRECIERAVALDPRFATPYAELSLQYGVMAAAGLRPAREVQPLGKAAAEQALALDPSLPEALANLGRIAAFYDYDWKEAGRLFNLAMARDPAPPAMRQLYALYLLHTGRMARGSEEMERALQEDPLNSYFRVMLSVGLQIAGQDAQAAAECHRALDIDDRYCKRAAILSSIVGAHIRFVCCLRKVTRREFINSAAAAGALVAGARAAASSQAERPNVLFILADDLGYGDLSCYGRPDYQTPELDGLARQGVKFTSAYAAAPVCTPTRCAFATGRYPQRTEVGLYEPLTARDRDKGLPADQPTIASRLKANGYETALIGKWHLGWKPEFGPNRHGYDEFFGILSGSGDYFTHRAADAGGADLWENLEPVERLGYLTDLLSERAAAFITRRRTRPFYLSLHYTAPHSPWEGPEDEAIGHTSHGSGPMVDGGSLKIYASMVKSMDAGIGRVLEALRRARLDRQTLVIFTSDNGGERYSYNWPFSFQKLYLWEGGIRVPAIVRWTGTIPAGRVTDQPVITMDWTATILSVSGTTPDPAYPLDGEDVMPVCTGTGALFDRTLFWRTRTRAAARVGKWKYLDESGREQMFDLSVDPGEKNDLRASHADVFERIRAQYTAWNARMLPRPPAAPAAPDRRLGAGVGHPVSTLERPRHDR